MMLRITHDNAQFLFNLHNRMISSLLNKHLFSSNGIIDIMSEPSPGENLKELFDQFKFHLIYKNKPKTTQTSACQNLKNILSEIKRDSAAKRQRVRNMNETLQQMEKMEVKHRPSSTLQSRIWKPKKIDFDNLQTVKQEVLIIEKEKQTLQSQISELENSLSVIKKNVAEVKKKVEIEAAKEEKYKHISYLSKSIQRHTDSNKIINYRSYKKLVRYQEDAIYNLKKFKTTVRKDNEDLESRYLQYKENQEKQGNKNKLDYSVGTTTKIDCNSDVKIDKSFFNKLEELIKLFIEKQPSFEEMKAQQTTKIRLKKVQKGYLKEERVKLHEMIDRFEEKHDVKIESLPNLILHIYKRLNQDNEEMENQCIKHYRIKQILLEDMEKLKEKEQEIQEESGRVKNEEFQYEAEKKKKIARNSQIFIQFVILLHNLLGKFKYLFTMALTLNIQKKNFQDLLIQITNIYKSDSIFYQKDMEENSPISVDDNLTNFKEMEEILAQYESKNSLDKNDLLSLIFSDLRYTLMFRRCWLEEQIREGFEQDSLLQKISSIQERCEEIYDSKLKIYIHLLVSSLKALTMNKYEKKMIASSTVRDSLFLSIPKPIKVINFQENEESESNRNRNSNGQDRKFNSQSSQQQVPSFEFKDNPRKIINLLEDLKNVEKKTFKPFYFEPSQVYLYDNKIILPKYVF